MKKQMRRTLSKKAQKLVESHPVALSTTMPDGNPNVIGVACVQVVDRSTVLITDVYMRQTLIDIAKNPRVALLTWDKSLLGYKILGHATYYTSGRFLKQVKRLPENNGLNPKGALVVHVDAVIRSS